MKNSTLYLAVMLTLQIFCGIDIVTAQVSTSGSGWSWYNPEPIGNDISSFSIAPDGTQYICGKHGTLLKSTNGGLNFTPMNPVGEKELREIAAIESGGKIIVVGEDGARLSIDGGVSWLNPLLGEVRMNCVTFNGTTILIGGDLGKIWKSTNSGNIFSLVYNNPTCDFQAIIKVDAVTEVAIGTNGKIYKSMSGVWDEVNNLSGGIHLKGLAFYNANTGVVVGNNNMIMTTTNSGLSWSQPLQTGVATHLYDVVMPNASTIVTAGEDGKIYRSTSFGANWQSYTFPDSNSFPILTLGHSGGVIRGYGKYSVQILSTDNGLNWTWANSMYNYNTLTWADVPEFIRDNSQGDSVFAADIKGNFYRTADGGANWTKINTGTNLEIRGGHFINSETGWLVGGKSSPLQRIILKTTNGGTNWITQHTSFSNNLYDVHFFNSTTGIAAGNFGAILRTTNGGVNWTSISGVTWTLNKLYFFDDQTGIAVGESGKIFRTTNGGLNWTQVNTGAFLDTQFGVDFIDANTGVSVGSNGIMYRTTSGGQSWTQLPQITLNALYSISFADALTGFACGTNLGNDASILKTTDGGLSWARQNSGTDNILRCIKFVNNSVGFAVGEGGTILKTTNSGTPIGLTQFSHEIPTGYLLSQNYPNPFNPTTKIQFEIPLSRGVSAGRGVFVTLKLYDITGREAAVLINSDMSPGVYKYELDASSLGLSSGVYFYRLQADGFSDVKKMVLLK